MTTPIFDSNTPTTVIPIPQSSRRGYLLIIGLAVALVVVTLAGIIGVTNTRAELKAAQNELATTKIDLTNTQTQLAAANAQVTAKTAEVETWKGVSEGWRQCGVGVLEATQTLLNGSALEALAPLGSAETICEDARAKYDAATGGGFA